MLGTVRIAGARRALAALVVAAALAIGAPSNAGAMGGGHGQSTSKEALALHDAMRALRKAANQLTKLLKAHINAAVAVLQAARSGDAAATAKAKAAFVENGDEIARFLHAANPKHWSLHAMKKMMRAHLNQVIALAVDQLHGRYGAAVRLYDVYTDHILDTADMLSEGIIRQFPARFS